MLSDVNTRYFVADHISITTIDVSPSLTQVDAHVLQDNLFPGQYRLQPCRWGCFSTVLNVDGTWSVCEHLLGGAYWCTRCHQHVTKNASLCLRNLCTPQTRKSQKILRWGVDNPLGTCFSSTCTCYRYRAKFGHSRSNHTSHTIMIMEIARKFWPLFKVTQRPRIDRLPITFY